MSDRKFLDKAMERFRLAEDAESEVRMKALEAMKFRLGDQWDDESKTARGNRPRVNINRIPSFIRQVTNDIRQNRPGIKVVATDDDTVETAEIQEGMIRHIQTSSDAAIAYDTASDWQVTGGFGYARVLTDYVDEESSDQEIKIGRIKNPFSVYFDAMAQAPDYSDAMWCFITSPMRRDDYESQYGKFEGNPAEFETLGDNQAQWMSDKTILVAEYFVVNEEEETLHKMKHNKTGRIKHTTDDKLKNYTSVGSRTRKKRTITCYKISADKILETNEWPGKYIPIVPFLGEDFDIEGKRYLVGMVDAMKDPQKTLNFMTSASIEAIALAPKAPWLIAEGQIPSIYNGIWQESNNRNFPYLVYKPTSLEGNIIGEPHRIQTEPPIQAMIQAIAQANRDLMSIPGIYQASLGSDGQEISGTAISQRQRQGDVANFHFIDNQARAIRHIGRICQDLIPHIYSDARIVRIVKPDNTAEMVKINQPTGKMTTKGDKQIKQVFDVTTGNYDVVIESGPSYATKREQNQDALQALIKADPQIMQIAGDIVISEFDFNKAQELSERYKLSLPPALQPQPDGQNIPPQLMQKMQQQGQMIEQLTQAVHKAHNIIDQKTLELESKERIAAMNNEAGITEAALKAGTQGNIQLMQMELQHLQSRLQMLHDNMPIDGEGNAIQQPDPNATQQGAQPQPQQ